MRTDTAPFDNPKVRKAVRLAVDRQELVDLVMGGAMIVACDTPVVPSSISNGYGLPTKYK